jgi:hypothetical protein
MKKPVKKEEIFDAAEVANPIWLLKNPQRQQPKL